MEKIIKKLLIIGCGRLGQTVGKVLSKLPLEVIGIKRQLSKNNLPFRLLVLDIFSESFSKEINFINPDYVLYCVSSDKQTEESYQKNYVDGLRITIEALNQLDNFQHLFFISSTRVYGQSSENFLSELTYPQPADYGGRLLFKAEESIKKISSKSTILRLSGIYGDNRRYMLEMASDLARWPSEDRWTNRIHEEDIVSFINYLFVQIINNEMIESLYLLTDNHPVTLFEVLKWLRAELKLPLENIVIPTQINGKKLRSQILPKLKFSFKHSNYKSGYRQMISKLNTTN